MFKFRSGIHGLNGELGRHRGREGGVMNVRMLIMFCEIFAKVILPQLTTQNTKDAFSKLCRIRVCIVLKKHLLFWVVSCGRMTLALCLILLRIGRHYSVEWTSGMEWWNGILE